MTRIGSTATTTTKILCLGKSNMQYRAAVLQCEILPSTQNTTPFWKWLKTMSSSVWMLLCWATNLMDSKSFHLASANNSRGVGARASGRCCVCIRMEYKSTYTHHGAMRWVISYACQAKYILSTKRQPNRRKWLGWSVWISLSGHLTAKLLNNLIITVSFKLYCIVHDAIVGTEQNRLKIAIPVAVRWWTSDRIALYIHIYILFKCGLYG